jgi:aerobic-type carbon monoxide dehydrogenase small subunit (CoxS/CutS family)
MYNFTLNGKPFRHSGDGGEPLLWVLRESAGLTGTRFACGVGLCGACTVHIDGRARRACVIPVSAVAGKQVTTIEGLAAAGSGELHPVQQAWLEEDVAQCGYCQAGQIMEAADLLRRIPAPTDADIEREQTALCRCGTYARIRRAIHRAAEISATNGVAIAEPVPAGSAGETA